MPTDLNSNPQNFSIVDGVFVNLKQARVIYKEGFLVEKWKLHNICLHVSLQYIFLINN